MRKELGVFRRQLAGSRSGLGRRVGSWALSPADPSPSCSAPCPDAPPSPLLPMGTSLDPEVLRAPGAEGIPELAEGQCPCEDQVARARLLGRESCAVFPGLAGAGLQVDRLGRVSRRLVCAPGGVSQEAVMVTNTGLSPGLGGSLSDSVEKVHGSEALRGLP